MPSSSAANLKNLAAGVDAQLYDGQSTVGRPIRLQLNLASLSQRASVDTINPVTQAVLASNSIQDFRVINPQRRARRRRDGELWLELRGAYVHIVHDDARRAFLGWLDQFADRAAWQGHNNFLTILGATCFQILLFVVTATVFGGVGRRAIDQIVTPSFMSRAHIQSPWQQTEVCDAPAAQTVLETVSARMAPDVPVSWRVVTADGDGPVVRYLGGGTVLLNAQDLYRFGDPEILGAAIFLTLIEARRQTVDQLLASRGGNALAAQLQQMRLLPSLGTLLYGWSAAAFDRRAETLSLDDEALVAMAAQGLKTYGLIDYLAFLAALEEGNEAQNIVPRSLRDLPSAKQRLAVARAKLEQSTFMPTTGRPSLSWDEYVMLVDACNVPSSSLIDAAPLEWSKTAE